MSLLGLFARGLLILLSRSRFCLGRLGLICFSRGMFSLLSRGLLRRGLLRRGLLRRGRLGLVDWRLLSLLNVCRLGLLDRRLLNVCLLGLLDRRLLNVRLLDRRLLNLCRSGRGLFDLGGLS